MDFFNLELYNEKLLSGTEYIRLSKHASSAAKISTSLGTAEPQQ